MRFLRRGHADIDDPHYKGTVLVDTHFVIRTNYFSPEMQKYPEVPQYVYGALFIVALAVGIGCSYAGPGGVVLMPAWGILVFTLFSSLISVVLGFISATTGKLHFVIAAH